MWVSSKNKDFEPAPAGAHLARCYSVVDTGSHDAEWQGKKKIRTIVKLTFELPSELRQDGKPFSISKSYTASLGQRAALREDLESWRGEKFSNEQLSAFNLATVIGKPCLLNVIHEEGSDGTIYAKIAAIMPPTKGANVPPQINPSLTFSLRGPGGVLLSREELDMEAFESLHERIRELITTSYEWAQIHGKKKEEKTTHLEEELADDIPF